MFECRRTLITYPECLSLKTFSKYSGICHTLEFARFRVRHTGTNYLNIISKRLKLKPGTDRCRFNRSLVTRVCVWYVRYVQSNWTNNSNDNDNKYTFLRLIYEWMTCDKRRFYRLTRPTNFFVYGPRSTLGNFLRRRSKELLLYPYSLRNSTSAKHLKHFKQLA